MEFANVQERKTALRSKVCASCGKVCEIPFAPEEDEPFLCLFCFRERRPKF